MDYRIEAETKHRIRIRIGTRKLTEEQAKILKYAFGRAPGGVRAAAGQNIIKEGSFFGSARARGL